MLSRRRFLQLTGISLLGSQLDPFHRLFTAESLDMTDYRGRALTALAVRRARHFDAPIITHLWPDSIVRIVDQDESWYRLPEGYVQRTEVQPMLPYRPQTSIAVPSEPFWAEVAGPVAPIRRYCAADAPMVARIGHGGVAYVIDALPGDPFPWYGIEAAGDQLLGWTQAVHWQPTQVNALAEGSVRLHIDSQQRRLTVWQDDQVVLRAPFAVGGPLRPGSYAVKERIASTAVTTPGGIFHGAPWRLILGDDTDLAGVYWHNDFGGSLPGPAVQVTPLLARWLYSWLTDRSSVVVA